MWLYHFQDISNLIQLFIKLLTLTPPLCWFIVTLLVLGSSFFTHLHQGCVSCIALSPQSFCIQMWVSVAYVTFNDIYFTPFHYYFLNILDLHVIFFVNSCLLLLQFCYSCTIFVFNLFLQAFFAISFLQLWWF